MGYSDLEDMIDVLSIAIVREETEEAFFRRSSAASTSGAAKALFSEVADEMSGYRQGLEARRQRLLNAVADLKQAGVEREAAEVEREPVCQIPIREECRLVSEYDGKRYRFCSDDCRQAFELDPARYLKQQ